MDTAIDSAEVSLEDVCMMRDLLKAHDPNWGVRFGKILFPELTDIKAKQKVYNIVQNQIRHNKWRIMFIIEGKKLLDTYKSEKELVSTILNDLKDQ